MDTLINLTGSLDDIVFEGRNQAYGAFQLRRSYQRNLGSALGITVIAFSLLLLVPLVLPYFSSPEVAVKPAIGRAFPELKPQVYEIPKAKPVQQHAAAVAAVRTLPHAVIQTRVAPDAAVQSVAPTTLPQDIGAVGPPTVGVENTDGSSSGPGSPLAAATAEPAGTAAAVLYAEVMPDFVGGRSALQRYLQKHLRFPAAALAAQVSGKVFVSFVVQTDGSIGEVTVLKGLGYGTEEAAARVVREMPAWTPGLQNHHAVPVRFTLPISFQFE